jgi:zinc protease
MFKLRTLVPAFFLWSTVVQAGPSIENWETRNGARVLFVRAPELPMIDVRVAFDAGSARDLTLPGMALFTNAMLSEGAGGLSAEAISDRIDNVGANMRNDTQRDVAWLGLRSLTESAQLSVAIETFSQVLQAPSFPSPALERIRKLLLVGLKQREQNPAAVAEELFYANLYPQHAYGPPTDGNAASIKRIRRVDLLTFYRRYYVGRNAIIAIVGDLDRPKAEALANKLVDQLPSGVRAPTIAEPPKQSQPAVIKREHPSTQTHILLGQAVMTRPDPDFYPLYVANHALGGNGLVSVLAEAIREQRGLSYSVASHFIGMRAAGPFEAAIETRNSQAVEATQVLQKTIAEYVQRGPSDAELEAAIKNLSGGFPLRIDSNGKILEYLTSIGFYGLPLDYLDQFVARISSVTADQIRDAMRRRLKPEYFLTVIVGGTPQPNEPTAPIEAPALRAHDTR